MVWVKELSISSVFMYLLSHMEVCKTFSHLLQGEPRGWLHNRNCPQISFHQEVVPGLSILQNVLNSVTMHAHFYPGSLGWVHFIWESGKKKILDAIRGKKILDQAVTRKPWRVLKFFLLWKVREANGQLQFPVEGNPE